MEKENQELMEETKSNGKLHPHLPMALVQLSLKVWTSKQNQGEKRYDAHYIEGASQTKTLQSPYLQATLDVTSILNKKIHVRIIGSHVPCIRKQCGEGDEMICEGGGEGKLLYVLEPLGMEDVWRALQVGVNEV